MKPNKFLNNSFTMYLGRKTYDLSDLLGPHPEVK